MRSSRITSSGVVVFLLLQALSSCIRIELGHFSKYDIDKDSIFFRTMPSPSEVGADLVALELNGTPFVFPREGVIRKHFILKDDERNWTSQMVADTLQNRVEYFIEWHTDRREKKYNPHWAAFYIIIPDSMFQGKLGETKGVFSLGIQHRAEDGSGFQERWDCKDWQLSVKITRLNPKRNLISGEFSGTFKHKTADTCKEIEIKKGFFDLHYKNRLIR